MRTVEAEWSKRRGHLGVQVRGKAPKEPEGRTHRRTREGKALSWRKLQEQRSGQEAKSTVSDWQEVSRKGQ